MQTDGEMTSRFNRMAKHGLKLGARIPNFMKDSEAWRRGIHAAVSTSPGTQQCQYSDKDKLDVEIRLHLRNPKLTILDLDNRLKDIFDALQGVHRGKGASGELASGSSRTMTRSIGLYSKEACAEDQSFGRKHNPDSTL